MSGRGVDVAERWRCGFLLRLIAGVLSCFVLTSTLASDVRRGASVLAVKGEIPNSYFGMHIHHLIDPFPRTGGIVPWPSIQFGAWRLWDAGVSWRDLQPWRDGWRFDKLDAYVDAAERRGIEVLLTLGNTPRWASARPDEPCPYGLGCAAEPKVTDLWEDYVRTVATRYKGRIRYFEIWNEPNFSEMGGSGGFFTGSAKTMVELASSAYRIIHEVDPEANVLTPSVVGNDDMLNLYLRAGGGRWADIVAFHFYVYNPEELPIRIGHVREVMANAGIADKSLWNTEAGYHIDNPDLPRAPLTPPLEILSADKSAAYVARSVILGAASGLERYYWYAWDNEEMGLSRRRGSVVNSAGVAYARTRDWLLGVRNLECASPDRDLWVCRASKGGQPVWFAWAINGKRSWHLPREVNATGYTTLEGKTGAVGPQRGVEVGLAPILLDGR